MAWLVKKLSGSGFGQVLHFADLQVVTTGLLAEGGYSYVYSAREVATHPRLFAVKKMLAQDQETRQVAEMELSLLTKLSGEPGFVRCYGSYAKETVPKKRKEYFMLLEYCAHGSLVDLIYKRVKGEFERRPPLPQERVLSVFATLVAAVAHMHSLDPPVAHRDLKLENVLAVAKDNFVLCDFGSATTRRLGKERTRKEVIEEEERIAKYSTLMYRAPEMCDLYRSHQVDTKVDVWALGCILYCLCFREHPFNGESTLPILNGAWAIPEASEYSAAVHDIIKATLRPDPDLRPSAGQVLLDVRRALEQGSAPAAQAEPSAAGWEATFEGSFGGEQPLAQVPPSSRRCTAAASSGSSARGIVDTGGGAAKMAGEEAGGVVGEVAAFATFEADFSSWPSPPTPAAPSRMHVVLRLYCVDGRVGAELCASDPAASTGSDGACFEGAGASEAWAAFDDPPETKSAEPPATADSEFEFGEFEAACGGGASEGIGSRAGSAVEFGDFGTSRVSSVADFGDFEAAEAADAAEVVASVDEADAGAVAVAEGPAAPSLAEQHSLD